MPTSLVCRCPQWVLKPISVFATLALLVTLWGGLPIHAQRGDTIVRPDRVEVDWLGAARDAALAWPELSSPLTSTKLTSLQRARVAKRLRSYTRKEGMLPLARLSELVAPHYPFAANAPIPVLAPIEPTGLLRRDAQARVSALARSIETFDLVSDSSGYDIVATVSAFLLRELGITIPYKPQLYVGGSALSYGSIHLGDLVTDMQDVVPGLRRIAGSDDVIYAFRRYGVPYYVSVDCSVTSPDQVMLTCNQADAIVRAVIRNLHLFGGGPRAVRRCPVKIAPQPTTVSNDFTYLSPGNLMKGTSPMEKGGSAKQKVYGDNILFPLKDAPAFANSQVFMHGGNCLSTPGTTDHMIPLPKQHGDQHERYHCKQNDKPLLKWEGHKENYAYPWRDNACETRNDDGPAECPLTMKGHAGQDIRPSRCIGEGARCPIDVFKVIAVTDGWALWKIPQNHLRLKADDCTGLYYMYLHMSPKALKEAGMKMKTQVRVKRGDAVGKVGNFDKAVAGGTTAHLHFEVRRVPPDMPDNIGPSLVPYLTLIRAYERRIKAKGREITE